MQAAAQDRAEGEIGKNVAHVVVVFVFLRQKVIQRLDSRRTKKARRRARQRAHRRPAARASSGRAKRRRNARFAHAWDERRCNVDWIKDAGCKPGAKARNAARGHAALSPRYHIFSDGAIRVMLV